MINVVKRGLRTTIVTSLVFVFAGQAEVLDPNRLAYGKHNVGFKVLNEKDYSRPFLKSGESEGSARPMDIYVWYPAKNGATSKRFVELYQSGLAARLQAVMNKSQANASQKQGEFPLILYAAAQGADGLENALLCEVLASQGFIVASVASKGAHNQDMPFNHDGAEAQVRDLEFILGKMVQHPSVDEDNIGTLGFSFGGLNMVTLALKHKGIKAMVSLDGSLTNGYDILKDYKYLDVANFDSAFLGFVGDKGQIDGYPLLSDTSFADVHLLKVKDVMHTDFSSTNLLLADRPEFVDRAFVSMSNLTSNFFAEYLKSEKVFTPKLTSLSDVVYVGQKSKIASKQPEVTKDKYIAYIEAHGIDAGVQTYHQTKARFPNYQLFDYKTFRNVGLRFMRKDDFPNALKAYVVLADAFPDNPDSFRRLADVFMALKRFDEAADAITQSEKLGNYPQTIASLRQYLKSLR